MTTRDPDTVYVVLRNKETESFPGDVAFTLTEAQRYVKLSSVPKHIAVYDRRNEAERAHLEEAARILFDRFNTSRSPAADMKAWLAAERKRRSGA